MGRCKPGLVSYFVVAYFMERTIYETIFNMPRNMQDLAMAILFGIGYAGRKSGVGLLMAILWVIRSIGVSSGA